MNTQPNPDIVRTHKQRKWQKNDARIEWLEKAHQDHQGQMAEMMELLRTLVKEKGQVAGPSPQNETTHHE